MAGNSVIGLLRVLLTAETGQLETGLSKAKTQVKAFETDVQRFNREFGSLSQRLREGEQATGGFTGAFQKLNGALGGLLPAISAAGVGLLVKQFTDASSQLVDMRQNTDLSLGALQRFKFGAEQTGTSIDAIVRAIQFAQKAMSEGDKSFVGGLKQIGLSLDEVRAMKPETMFEEISSRIASIQDPAQRTALRMTLLGKTGRELGADFKALGNEADRLGLVMSDKTVEAGDDLGDNFDKLISVGKTLIGSVLSPLLPILNGLASALVFVLGPLGKLIGGFMDFLSPATRFADLMQNVITPTLQAFGLAAQDLPKVMGPAAQSLERMNEAIRKRGELDTADVLKNEDQIIRDLTDTLKDNNEAWDKAAAAQKKAQEEIEAASNELNETQRKQLDTLDAIGATTTEVMVHALEPFIEKLNLAKAQGVIPLQQALINLSPELEKLRERAIAAGADINIFDGILNQLREDAGLTADAMIALERSIPVKPWTDALGKMQQYDVVAEQAAAQTNVLEQAFKTLGLTSQTELDKTAREATKAWQVIVQEFGAGSAQAKAAYEKMIEAVNAATHKVPSVWESEIFPRIKATVDQIGDAVSGTFAQMIVHAKGFKDGFLDVWRSIQNGIAQILSSILNDFINRFLKGLLGAITGQQGAFAKAFSGLFGGGGGLLGNAAGLAGLLGAGAGAVVPAAVGIEAGIPIIGGAAAFGTPVAPGAAGLGAAGIGAAGAGLLSGGAGFGLGALLQHFFGRGAGSSLLGAGAGAGAGLAISAALAPATMGLSALIGGLSGLVGALINFGPSKKEREARVGVQSFQQNTFANLTDAQRKEAQGAGWADPTAAGTLIAVRDAYIAMGKSAQDAERDVKAIWDAEKEGPEATAAAMKPVLAALEEYKKKHGEAAAATSAAIDQEKAKFTELKEHIQSQMADLDKELADLNRSEAPEAHMGTVEKRARERIAKQKADLQKQLADAEAASKAAIDAITKAAAAGGEAVGRSFSDGAKAGFDEVLVDGTHTVDDLKAHWLRTNEDTASKIPGPYTGCWGRITDGGFKAADDIEQAMRDAAAKGVGPDGLGKLGDFLRNGLGRDARNGVDDIEDAFGDIHIPKIRVPFDLSGLPEGIQIPRLQGHASGGLFPYEHVARIAENSPEIIGDQGFMTRVVAGAMQTIGMNGVKSGPVYQFADGAIRLTPPVGSNPVEYARLVWKTIISEAGRGGEVLQGARDLVGMVGV